MNAAHLLEALDRHHNVRLGLNPDKTRVTLSSADAARLPDDLKKAIKANHDDLLRFVLFKDGMHRLQRYLLENLGLDPRGPHYAAAVAGAGANGTHDALNDAWFADDLPAFKAALSEYLRASKASLNRPSPGAQSQPAPDLGPEEPALPLGDGAEPA